MTDLTDSQRVERARRATLALEEFIDPAIDAVIAAYTARIEELSATQPWEAQKITLLANATRIARQVRAQVAALVHDGVEAKSKIDRAKEIEKLSPARRRFLDMVPH